ncbi:MAG: efflux RND transporter periplasmic adaptor subunit [Candidatus Marinimicrobia bacterium]|nr:efflux RND transporter periplasmic adaptor subunit [Candidatus Neomarinimicrobiota bacterium]
MNNILDKIKTAVFSIPRYVWGLILVAFLLGLWIGGPGEAKVKMTEHDLSSAQSEVAFWTCAMHPQINLPDPGQCPICFMDLIPMETSTGGEGPREYRMSEAAVAIAGIATTPVRRDIARAETRLSGKVAYDETLMKHITAWFPGRLEHLYVDYTGISVKEGDHMAEIYSPKLYAAQEEYLQALMMVEREKSVGSVGGRSAQVMLESAQEKLRLLGLTLDQIREIEDRGTPSDRIEIYSPLSGIVIHKNAVEGMYVKTGTRIYTVADLSRVWIILDAYESDLAWMAYGQEVSFQVEALPGKMFSGRVSFIDPVLDPKTRAVKVRLNISNQDGKLKPNMFVKATVHSQIDAHGHVVNPYMAGKWVGSMHPEIVKDNPGDCDICGMPLVRAEDLGIVHGSQSIEKPLLVPASAVLLTGKRAVVYVQVPNQAEPLFEGREVQLGARTGDDYIIVSGLKEGELVVTKGNFKIDSAMQIAAKPSMMNPEGGVAMTGHAGHGDMSGSTPKTSQKKSQPTEDHSAHISQGEMNVNEQFMTALDQMFQSYFTAQSALAGDDQDPAVEALLALQSMVIETTIGKTALSGQAKIEWKQQRGNLLSNLEHLQHWTSIAAVRKGFHSLSATMLEIEQTYGHSGEQNYYQVFCPMAFDNKGAFWLQSSSKVKNPYLGSKMLGCGDIKAEFNPRIMTDMKGGH